MVLLGLVWISLPRPHQRLLPALPQVQLLLQQRQPVQLQPAPAPRLLAQVYQRLPVQARVPARRQPVPVLAQVRRFNDIMKL